MGAVVGGRVAVGVKGVEHGLGQHPGIADAVGIQHPQRHDAGAGCHHRHQAGHMGAMAPGAVGGAAALGRVGVAIDKITARQQPAGQQRVAGIHARVEHGHPHPFATGPALGLGQVQGLRRPLRHVGRGGADGPGHVLARLGAAVGGVGLGDHHLGVEHQPGQHVLDAHAADHLEPVDRPGAEAAEQRHRVGGQQRPERLAAAQLDQDLARHVGIQRAAAGGAGCANAPAPAPAAATACTPRSLRGRERAEGQQQRRQQAARDQSAPRPTPGVVRPARAMRQVARQH